jgi:hypothetical protein
MLAETLEYEQNLYIIQNALPFIINKYSSSLYSNCSTSSYWTEVVLLEIEVTAHTIIIKTLIKHNSKQVISKELQKIYINFFERPFQSQM